MGFKIKLRIEKGIQNNSIRRNSLMYFTKIRLKNFCPFFDAEFDFEPHAINWIIGEICSGKTQMVGAMLAAIVGKTALSITAGGNGPSSVALDMRDGQISETTFLDTVETSRGKFDVL